MNKVQWDTSLRLVPEKRESSVQKGGGTMDAKAEYHGMF